MKFFRRSLAAAIVTGAIIVAAPGAHAVSQAEADTAIALYQKMPCQLIKIDADTRGMDTRSDVYDAVKSTLGKNDTTAEQRKHTNRAANAIADRYVACKAVKNDISAISSGSSFSLSS